MASKFWQEDSSSEDEQPSDNESIEERQVGGRVQERRFAAAFIDDSDSDSDDEVRVVKSQKQRVFESIDETINKLKNAKKNGDWSTIQDEFNNANKQIEKSKMLIAQHGIPPSYIKMLADLEDHIQVTLKDKETVKKMKPVVSKALNQLKLQIKKHNEQYKSEIGDYRAHPEKYEETEQDEASSDSESGSSSESGSGSDSESDDESESDESVKKPAGKPSAKAASESDSEDSLFEREDLSSSSESEEEGEGRPTLTGRARWLKKAPGTKEKEKEKEKDKKKVVLVKNEREKERDKEREKPTNVSVSVSVSLTAEEVERRLKEVLGQRGKKGVEPREVLRQLESLSRFCVSLGAQREIPLLFHSLSARFETLRGLDDVLELSSWNSAARSLQRVLSLLSTHPHLSLSPLGEDETLGLSLSSLSATSSLSTSEEKVRVVGTLETFLGRLGDELLKLFQQTSPHSRDYLSLLSAEALLSELYISSLHYLVSREGDKERRATTTIVLRLQELLYFKSGAQCSTLHSSLSCLSLFGQREHWHPASRSKKVSVVERDVTRCHPASFQGSPGGSTPLPGHFFSLPLPREIYTTAGERDDPCLSLTPQSSEEEREAVYSRVVAALGRFVFSCSDVPSEKTRALLYTVYHVAVQGRFHEARDLFLLGHIPDFADKADIKTQILYNRTLVQLGLAAFQKGIFNKAHELLSPICTNPRWKELLAQGTMRVSLHDPSSRDLAAEREERRRLVPFHLQFHPDLLETAHLTSALLLELPQLARHSANATSTSLLGQPGTVSKWLRKFLVQFRRASFLGPPETVREHLLATTEAVLRGEVAQALHLLLHSLDSWVFLSRGTDKGRSESLRSVKQKLREECVRVLLLQAAEVYSSLALSSVVEQLRGTKEEEGDWEGLVLRIARKMVFSREIPAQLVRDEAEGDVLKFHAPPASTSTTTSTATASLSVLEKLSSLEESSERSLDFLAGGLYNFKDDWTHSNFNNANAASSGPGRHPRGSAGRGTMRSAKPLVPRQHPRGGGGRGGGRGGPKKAWGNQHHSAAKA